MQLIECYGNGYVLNVETQSKVKMKTYKIAVSWTEVGTILVKANTVELAIIKAKKNIDNIILSDSEYLDDSFQIDEDTTKLLDQMNTNKTY